MSEVKYQAILSANTRAIESAQSHARRVVRAVAAYLVAVPDTKPADLAKRLAGDTGTTVARWRQIVMAAGVLNTADVRPDDDTVSAVLSGASNGTPVGALKDAVQGGVEDVQTVNREHRAAVTAKREAKSALGQKVTAQAAISALEAITTGNVNTSAWTVDDWQAYEVALSDALKFARDAATNQVG